MNRRELIKGLPVFVVLGLSACSRETRPSGTDRAFHACKAQVHNRGKAPNRFLNEIFDWANTAPDEIFARNNHHDIYQQVHSELGPWQDSLHRKAAMLEVLRVLAGYESSWQWQAGKDSINPLSNTPCTAEAGIFQCSADSMNFDRSLKSLLRSSAGQTDCKSFRHTTKNNHRFAIEYCARLLRFTTNHHGPVKHRQINRWLSKRACEEFRQLLLAER